jgi:hypothetical protein
MWPYPLLQIDTSWGLFRILKWALIAALLASALRPAVQPSGTVPACSPVVAADQLP